MNPSPAVSGRNRDMIFVFGSNTAGIHGAGAARTALLQHGAVWGVGSGYEGRSYAIPTKEGDLTRRVVGKVLPYVTINWHVEQFILFARSSSAVKFQVTQIGCGLAGLDPAIIALMFEKAPENCYFDTAWLRLLPERSGAPYRFWGTYP